MKAKDLKNSILQLAIQGKLVPQDPKDEPASKLLEKIRAAKQKLVKEGKIKKDKQESFIYKGDDNNYYEKIGTEVRNITDEIPFEIPDNWAWVRLKNVSFRISAGGDKPQCFSKIMTKLCQVPVLSNGEKNNGLFGYTDKATIFEPSVTVSGRGTIGFSCVRKKPYFPIVRLITITPFSGIDLTFLQCTLLALLEQGIGTSIKQLTVPMLAPKLIPLPPLQEQEGIVSRIATLYPLIEEYDKVERELTTLNETFPEQIKKSILQYAIQGKLVPQDPKDEPASVLLEKIKAEKQKLIKAGKIKKDKVESYIYKRDNRHYEKMGDKEVDITDEIPFEIPNSWVWVRLGNVVNYGETPTVSYPQCQDKNMWILDLENIEKDTSKLLSRYRIKDKKFNSTKKTFCKGNVLYCKLRPYLNKVMVADEDGICTSEIIPLQIYYGIVPEYLKECLKSPYFYQYVNSLTYGIKMPRLGTTNGKRSLIPLPPIQEQQRIVEKIEQLFKILP